jgi:hypothetical protein
MNRIFPKLILSNKVKLNLPMTNNLYLCLNSVNLLYIFAFLKYKLNLPYANSAHYFLRFIYLSKMNLRNIIINSQVLYVCNIKKGYKKHSIIIING